MKIVQTFWTGNQNLQTANEKANLIHFSAGWLSAE
jgi:hypothetical protein